MITGADLIAWGYTPGPWFKDALPEAARQLAKGVDRERVLMQLAQFAPVPVDMGVRVHCAAVEAVYLNSEHD